MALSSRETSQANSGRRNSRAPKDTAPAGQSRARMRKLYSNSGGRVTDVHRPFLAATGVARQSVTALTDGSSVFLGPLVVRGLYSICPPHRSRLHNINDR